MAASLEEVQLVLALVQSIPHVFSRRGTPDDLNFILSNLKQAICLRGISVSSQRLFVDLLAPLGGFKVGLLDVKQLQLAVDRAVVNTPYLPAFYRKVC
jgi:hypothetical protein